MADAGKSDSVLGLFLRLYWIMIGNAVLAIAAVLPVANPQVPVAPLMAVYVLSVAALIAARYVDIRACGGQTVHGTPADMGHWKRYVAILLPVSLLLPGITWAFKALIDRLG